VRRLLACLAVVMMTACATLPPPDTRQATSAYTDTAETRIGRALAPALAANPGRTGVYAVPAAHEAFGTRVLLAAAAERSLDLQYYIWHADPVGYLLFEAVWNAAERGVRMRLLLDDAPTDGMDWVIAALDSHTRIEVRLYNPLVYRNARLANFLTDFSRVNRRMHNKSFTVDNQVSVVGGRNIGNEYFGAGEGMTFRDLDVVAVGSAVGEVSKEFDLYWNSGSAYPAAQFVGTEPPDAVARLKERFSAVRADPAAHAYLEAVRATPLVQALLDRTLQFEWTAASVVYDDPAKTVATDKRTDILLFSRLISAIGQPQRSFDLITPYFVPGEHGTAALVALARQGVQVRILTNSLAGSDVAAVHAGYAKRREDLLRGGVRLYELKPTAGEQKADDSALGSSSSTGLHAKTFAVDRARAFVGSFNFDQRSAHLNTEMGLVIESPTLAGRMAHFFDSEVASIAYEVRLSSGKLEWIERTPTGERRHDTEPETSWARRLGVDLFSILPIEWLL
jgi:putative cardiolipin synthase